MKDDMSQTTSKPQAWTGETILVDEADFMRMLNDRVDSLLNKLTVSTA